MLLSNTHKIPRLNSGHHLTPDDCWIFNQKIINSIGFHSGNIVSPNGIFDTTPLGEALVHTSTAHKEGLGLDSDLLPTQNCTIVLRYRKSDTTNRSSAAFGIDDGVGAVAVRCGGHIPFSDGTVYWDFGGATEGVTRVSSSGLSFDADTWVFTTGARGMEIWQNGLKRASNSANPTRSVSSSDFALGAGGAAVSDLAEYAFIYIYKHQLSESEILEITQNPYIFLSDNSYFYDKLDLFLPNYFPDPISVNWSIVTPTLSLRNIITPTDLTANWDIVTPTLNNKTSINPSNLEVHWTIISPTIKAGAGNLTPNALTTNWGVVTPTIKTHAKLFPTNLSAHWSILGNYDVCPAGPYYPASAVNDSSVGNVAWVNLDNAAVSDNVYTTVTLADQTSQNLQVTGFNFNISPNKIINGIKVEVECKTLLGTELVRVRLLKNGVQTPLGFSVTALWETTEAFVVYDPNDTHTYLWGESWTPADINASNFGVNIRESITITDTLSVDSVRVTVYCADKAGFKSIILSRWVGGLSASPPPLKFGFRSFINRWVGGLNKAPFVTNYNVTPTTLTANWTTVAPTIVGGAGKGFRTAIGRRFAWVSLQASPTNNLIPTALTANWSIVTPTLKAGGKNVTASSLTANWSVVTPSIQNQTHNITPNSITVNWSIVAPNVQFQTRNVTPTTLTVNWSIVTPSTLNDSSTISTYPTNLLVLDRSVINFSMAEKDISQQTAYNLAITPNQMKQSSKLRVTATLARNKGILKTNRLKCSYTNPQAVIGITKEDEPFYTGPFYNNSVNGNDPDSAITDFLVTSAVDNVAIAGVCYVRMCCPPFRDRIDQATNASDGTFPNFSPNGVFAKDIEYGPACTYQDSFVRFENILEGVPKTALLLHIKPGSTVQNMTAYGAVYDSGTNKLSLRMWKNQSLLDDEGHIFAEANYTMQPGDYLGFIADMSDKDFFYPPQPTWYPYVNLEVYIFNNSTAGITLYWELNNPTISGSNTGPFNTPWDNLIFPEKDSYAGMAALGVNNSTSCISRSQWSDFEAGCGLCYVASGWQDFPFDIDWSCNDRVWYEYP